MIQTPSELRQSDLFGIKIDAIDMKQAVARVMKWVSEEPPRCKYVVTPNVDHAVLLRENEGLRDACLLYTSPSPRDRTRSRMPSSA